MERHSFGSPRIVLQHISMSHPAFAYILRSSTKERFSSSQSYSILAIHTMTDQQEEMERGEIGTLPNTNEVEDLESDNNQRPTIAERTEQSDDTDHNIIATLTNIKSFLLCRCRRQTNSSPAEGAAEEQVVNDPRSLNFSDWKKIRKGQTPSGCSSRKLLRLTSTLN